MNILIRSGMALAMAGVVSMGAGAAQAAGTGSADSTVAAVLTHVPHDAQGRVTRQTFLAYMEAAFDRMDTDRTGSIDPASIKVVKSCVPMRGWRYVPGASLTGC